MIPSVLISNRSYYKKFAYGPQYFDQQYGFLFMSNVLLQKIVFGALYSNLLNEGARSTVQLFPFPGIELRLTCIMIWGLTLWT